MILAIDAGNSRVKWALHDGRRYVRDGWAPTGDLSELDAAWREIPPVAIAVIANVAGEAVRDTIQSFLARRKINGHFVSGVRQQCGVVSGYDDPAQLGSDRWAALIGARAHFSGDCLVVNVGTAMTVDALSSAGEFLGGIIVPGFDLMHDALASRTALLSAETGQYSIFPRNTQDAMTSGAIQALCGAVERMRQAMLGAGKSEPTLIVGGGAAEKLVQALGRPVRHAERLVLDGMVRIAADLQETR
ncbi:MAG: type III pantothenate kinase [Burkholderiales bacterium]